VPEALGKLHAVEQQARLLAWGVDSAAPALLCALCCALAVAARSIDSKSQVTSLPFQLYPLALCSAQKGLTESMQGNTSVVHAFASLF